MKVLFHTIEEGVCSTEVDENDMRAKGLDQIIKTKCKDLHLRWNEEIDVIVINDYSGRFSIESYYDMMFQPVKEV